MNDTCCQRHGYDNTGRYHVPGPGPEPEKCEHCGGTHKPWVMCDEVKDPETFYGPKFPAAGNMADQVNIGTGAASSQDAVSQTGNTTAPVNIPRDMQERLLALEYTGIVRQLAMWLDECEDQSGAAFDDELRDLALSRLRSGYEQYGSEMFTWDAETRRRNVMEELADAIVYLCSGPVE